MTKVSKSLGESGKPCSVVMGSIVVVCNANASVNLGFMNVETAIVIQDDFGHGLPPAIVFTGSARIGRPENRVDFLRDKFTGCFFAQLFGSLTGDRHHLHMRGCRYTAPPLTSTGSVVC